MNDAFRGHSPLPNDEEIAWMSVEPFAAIRRVALLAALAFVVATALSPAEPVTPVTTEAQPERQEPRTVDANGGVLASSGWAPAFARVTSALRPLV